MVRMALLSSSYEEDKEEHRVDSMSHLWVSEEQSLIADVLTLDVFGTYSSASGVIPDYKKQDVVSGHPPWMEKSKLSKRL